MSFAFRAVPYGYEVVYTEIPYHSSVTSGREKVSCQGQDAVLDPPRPILYRGNLDRPEIDFRLGFNRIGFGGSTDLAAWTGCRSWRNSSCYPVR